MNTGMIPVVESHLGQGYESYVVFEEFEGLGRILQKSLTDNSMVYDIQILDDCKELGGTIGCSSLNGAREIFKALEKSVA